jgi:HD-GYP domain-containing protein (c-di-GMP phosphodiesterase class II)
MTYTNPSDFSNASTDQTPSTVEKMKTLQKESTQRSQRLMKILRTAFTETVAEFKAGREVISPLAKEVTAETVAGVKEKSQQAKKTINQAWQQDSESEDRTERLIRLVRVLAKTTAKTAQEKLFPQVKTQASKLDDVLSNRYGDRYATLKDRFDSLRSRYAPEQTTPEPTANSSAANSSAAIEVESEVIR